MIEKKSVIEFNGHKKRDGNGSGSSPLLSIGNVANQSRLSLIESGTEVFRVTPSGEIEANGKNITDDDAAVADCLRAWVKCQAGIDIRPAKRNG